MMNICLNGESQEIPDGTSVGGLLRLLEMPSDRVAVERNREIVPRAKWETTPVNPSDRLEVVHFVGGG